MIKNIIRLIRWDNLLFIAIALWVMEKWVVVPLLQQNYFPEQLSNGLLACIILAFVFISAGGYVINDYFDFKIEEINRPDKVVVMHGLSKKATMRLYQVLTGIGIIFGVIVAWELKHWVLGLIFLFIPGILWFYSASYKRQLLIGNLIVSLLAGFGPFLIIIPNIALLSRYGDFMQGSDIFRQIYLWLGGFGVFAFLTTWTREIIKDIEDQVGDREFECHTVPIVWGDMMAKIMASLLILITMTLLIFLWVKVLPFPIAWQNLPSRYIMLGLLVPFVGELVLLWRASIPSDYRSAQLLMKFIMFMGVMFSFAVRFA